jgi:hypothetical protein
MRRCAEALQAEYDAIHAHAADATPQELVGDWRLEHAGSGRILGRRRRPIKPSTLAMDESRIETHIRPLLGSRSMRGLTLWDIEGMQSAIVAGRSAKPRSGRGGVTTGGAGVASRAVGTLRAIFGYAKSVFMSGNESLFLLCSEAPFLRSPSSSVRSVRKRYTDFGHPNSVQRPGSMGRFRC